MIFFFFFFFCCLLQFHIWAINLPNLVAIVFRYSEKLQLIHKASGASERGNRKKDGWNAHSHSHWVTYTPYRVIKYGHFFCFFFLAVLQRAFYHSTHLIDSLFSFIFSNIPLVFGCFGSSKPISLEKPLSPMFCSCIIVVYCLCCVVIEILLPLPLYCLSLPVIPLNVYFTICADKLAVRWNNMYVLLACSPYNHPCNT